MPSWTPADLDLISRNTHLVVSPFRDDGITFAEAPVGVADAIDAANEDNCPCSAAVPVMQADGPKSPTAVIEPR
jgi:hypothetical protein